jgi:hypothetical protein
MTTGSIRGRRLLVESFAVVVSILLAFAIDASWDDRRERIEEEALLAGVLSEFEQNIEEVATQLERVQAARDRLRRYPDLAEMTGGMVDADSAYTVLVQPVIRSYTSELSDGFLNATITSGKLALIKDIELRALLAQTTSIDENTSEMRQVLMDLSVAGAIALGEHTEVAPLMDAGTRRAIAASAFRAPSSDPDVLAVVRAKQLYMGFYVGQLESLGAHLATITAAIERHLGEEG